MNELEQSKASQSTEISAASSKSCEDNAPTTPYIQHRDVPLSLQMTLQIVTELKNFFSLSKSGEDSNCGVRGSCFAPPTHVTQVDSNATDRSFALLEQNIEVETSAFEQETGMTNEITNSSEPINFQVTADVNSNSASAEELLEHIHTKADKNVPILTKQNTLYVQNMVEIAYNSNDIDTLFRTTRACMGSLVKNKADLKQKQKTAKTTNEHHERKLRLMTEENKHLKKQVKALMEYIQCREADVRDAMVKIDTEVSRMLDTAPSSATHILKLTSIHIERSQILAKQFEKFIMYNRQAGNSSNGPVATPSNITQVLRSQP